VGICDRGARQFEKPGNAVGRGGSSLVSARRGDKWLGEADCGLWMRMQMQIDVVMEKLSDDKASGLAATTRCGNLEQIQSVTTRL